MIYFCTKGKNTIKGLTCIKDKKEKSKQIMFILCLFLGRGSKEVFVVEMKKVVNKWSFPKREVAREIFGLLADLSENSLSTRVDASNLAGQWSPILLPIPETKQSAEVQTIVKNTIIFCEEIFTRSKKDLLTEVESIIDS